jgi:cobalamin synthase
LFSYKALKFAFAETEIPGPSSFQTQKNLKNKGLTVEFVHAVVAAILEIFFYCVKLICIWPNLNRHAEMMMKMSLNR